MPSQNKQECPTCGQSVNKREIGVSSVIVTGFLKLFRWCDLNDQWEFTTKDVRDMLDHNEYARLGDQIYLMAGAVYRPEGHSRGRYGINKKRALEIINGDRKIPEKILKDPLKDSLEKSEDLKTIYEVRNISEWLNSEGQFVADYQDKVQL